MSTLQFRKRPKNERQMNVSYKLWFMKRTSHMVAYM
jgi:hypothetical protein